jgi:hypothetical protein
MMSRRQLISLGSVALSLLILVLGWDRIQDKVRQRPTINEDGLLTPDELQDLPPDVLRAVVPRSAGSSTELLTFRILRLSLEKSGERFALGYGEGITDQEAGIQHIAAATVPSKANPNGTTVGIFGIGPEINRRLRPVAIPLVGGLLGLRGLWVNANRLDRFRSVDDLEDLRTAVAVQGIGWSDVEILEQAGIRTYTIDPLYILELLDQDRVDFYPRGISELEQDAALIRRQSRQVGLDRHLILAYPFAIMFYVHPSNERLHRALEKGLRRAHADGSLRRLIDGGVFTPWLRRNLALENRTVITLRNPDQEELMQEVDPSYWLVPWRELSSGHVRTGEELCGYGMLRKLCSGP